MDGGWNKRKRQQPPPAPTRRKSFARFRRMKPNASVTSPLTTATSPPGTPPSPEIEALTNSLFEEQLDHAKLETEEELSEEEAVVTAPLSLSVVPLAQVPAQTLSPCVSDSSDTHSSSQCYVPHRQDSIGSEQSQDDVSSEASQEGPHEEVEFEVTCPACGRTWDGQAQCYPCIDLSDEE